MAGHEITARLQTIYSLTLRPVPSTITSYSSSMAHPCFVTKLYPVPATPEQLPQAHARAQNKTTWLKSLMTATKILRVCVKAGTLDSRLDHGTWTGLVVPRPHPQIGIGSGQSLWGLGTAQRRYILYLQVNKKILQILKVENIGIV